jgi:hypothetical protein
MRGAILAALTSQEEKLYFIKGPLSTKKKDKKITLQRDKNYYTLSSDVYHSYFTIAQIFSHKRIINKA